MRKLYTGRNEDMPPLRQAAAYAVAAVRRLCRSDDNSYSVRRVFQTVFKRTGDRGGIAGRAVGRGASTMASAIIRASSFFIVIISFDHFHRFRRDIPRCQRDHYA